MKLQALRSTRLSGIWAACNVFSHPYAAEMISTLQLRGRIRNLVRSIYYKILTDCQRSIDHLGRSHEVRESIMRLRGVDGRISRSANSRPNAWIPFARAINRFSRRQVIYWAVSVWRASAGAMVGRSLSLVVGGIVAGVITHTVLCTQHRPYVQIKVWKLIFLIVGGWVSIAARPDNFRTLLWER